MIGDIVLTFFSPMLVGYVFSRFDWPFHGNFYVCWFVAAIGGVLGCVLPPDAQPIYAPGYLASAGLAAFLWWLSRRRRKRASRQLGAKSRALLASLVRKMREQKVPRPVLRPQPQGV